jgi:hypothetical protein
MAGRIRLVEAAPHPKWLPGAGFLFGRPRKKGSTGVQLGLMPGDPNNLTATIRDPNQPGPIAVGQVPAKEWVPVSASLRPGGMLEVTIAGTMIRRRVRVKSGQVPFLMCNSGTFEFELEEGMKPTSERFPER